MGWPAHRVAGTTRATAWHVPRNGLACPSRGTCHKIGKEEMGLLGQYDYAQLGRDRDEKKLGWFERSRYAEPSLLEV